MPTDNLPRPMTGPRQTLSSDSTERQPINKAFAHHLPTAGDGLSRIEAYPDAMTGPDEPEMMKGLTLEKTGDDASCRLDSHPVSEVPPVGLEPTTR